MRLSGREGLHVECNPLVLFYGLYFRMVEKQGLFYFAGGSMGGIGRITFIMGIPLCKYLIS